MVQEITHKDLAQLIEKGFEGEILLNDGRVYESQHTADRGSLPGLNFRGNFSMRCFQNNKTDKFYSLIMELENPLVASYNFGYNHEGIEVRPATFDSEERITSRGSILIPIKTPDHYLHIESEKIRF